MSKKLAIKGHSTRGKEVMELLKMMGGEAFRTKGNDETAIYVIPENGIIDVRFAYQKHIDNYAIFTLEEFLEKYPYKVGDKVHIYVQTDDFDGRCDVKVTEITSMRWNPVMCKIAYKMKNINREFYKEEIKCKVDDDSNKTTLKGAEWADNNPQSGMFNIADAISWLEEHLGRFKSEYGRPMVFYNKKDFIEAFKKAMEE